MKFSLFRLVSISVVLLGNGNKLKYSGSRSRGTYFPEVMANSIKQFSVCGLLREIAKWKNIFRIVLSCYFHFYCVGICTNGVKAAENKSTSA